VGDVVAAGGPDLILRLPREDEEEEFLRAHHATSPGVPYFLHHYEEGMRLRRYLEILRAYRRGERLPPGHVPATFLFAFVGPSIVGRVSVRHALNEVLEQVGGHIGYVVVPAFRRRGYATSILRMALQIAHEELGIGRVLVTCDDDNIGSIKTIEKNGGVLENIVMIDGSSTPKRRYWFAAVPPVTP
jgi:predicted acetyltransferase